MVDTINVIKDEIKVCSKYGVGSASFALLGRVYMEQILLRLLLKFWIRIK